CWCTRAEIREAASAPHGALPEGAYPGTCRRLGAAERAERELSGRPAALRLDAASAEIAFHDRLHGDLSGAVDDFVLWRGDDAPAYQLAVVVDDAASGITDVLRGDDLLSSTPRQLQIHEALGQQPPRFWHVPLVLGEDGKRLAKREGAFAVAELRERGIAVERVLGLLAAWSGLGDGAPVTREELVRRFRPELLPRSPVVAREELLKEALGLA
ncbi:MAG: glutamate--tRNA ligase family protein, partial [Archangium sp.]